MKKAYFSKAKRSMVALFYIFFQIYLVFDLVEDSWIHISASAISQFWCVILAAVNKVNPNLQR